MDGDGYVTPIDAIRVINHINATTSLGQAVPAPALRPALEVAKLSGVTRAHGLQRTADEDPAASAPISIAQDAESVRYSRIGELASAGAIDELMSDQGEVLTGDNRDFTGNDFTGNGAEPDDSVGVVAQRMGRKLVSDRSRTRLPLTSDDHGNLDDIMTEIAQDVRRRMDRRRQVKELGRSEMNKECHLFAQRDACPTRPERAEKRRATENRYNARAA